MMTNPDDSVIVQEKLDETAKHRRQIWVIVAVMLVAFCVGTSALLALIWYVLKFLLPSGSV
jgi:hypothetical protein